MIQKYENGKTRVPEQRLNELCHHLDVSPDYFTGGAIAFAGPDAGSTGIFRGLAGRQVAALPRDLGLCPTSRCAPNWVDGDRRFLRQPALDRKTKWGRKTGWDSKMATPAPLVRWLRQMTLKGGRQKTGGGQARSGR